MSVDRLTKEPMRAETGRLAAHALGLLGANLVVGTLYLWGMPLVTWLSGGQWYPSAIGRLLFGGGSVMMPMDLLIGLAVAALGVWLVTAGARILVDRT
jgi:hypothetical protein